MKALVVDDSRTARSLMAGILEELGFEVASAETGVEALRELESHAAFDLILVDWNMPEMDGISLVRRIRADERMKDARLMLVTTRSSAENVAEALEAGADEYLMKPFTREMLAAKLGWLDLQTS